MAADTETSGTRIFHQVRPSGRAGGRRAVLQLAPAESAQTRGPIASSVRVVPVLAPRGNAPAVLPNTTLTLTALGQDPTGSPSLQTLPSLSCSAAIRTFLPKSTKTAFRPETLIRTTPPGQSEGKTVIIFSEPQNDPIVKPHATSSTAQPREAPLLHTSTHPFTSDTIRTFSKVPQFPPTPDSPIQWVVKDAGCSQSRTSEPSLISPAVVSEVLDVVAKREQRSKARVNAGDTDPAEAQPECSVLMFDDKIFFRVEKQDTREGETIDLCRDDEVSDGETPADEESVKFVSYTPAPAAEPRAEDGTGTCARSAPQAPGGTPTDPTQAAATSCSREGHTQRGHTPQPQIPSGPSLAPCPVADHKLKLMFGITSEVEIRLPRVVSCDAHTTAALQAPPPDYTEPIEEDFLCATNPPHARDCPQVEGSASRVGRTRKRTKCPCCSPAVLHRYHQKRRAKPGHGERRETARRQLKLPEPGATSECTPVTAPPIPRKQAKPPPAPVTVPMTASASTPLTTPQFVRKQTKLKHPPGTTAQIPRKPSKLPPTPETSLATTSVTEPQISRTPDKLQSAPGTAPVTPPTTPQTPPSIAPLTASLTTRIVTQLTTPVTTPLTPRTVEADKDSEEMQIHKEIERLREALRLQEAALEKFKSDKNR